MGGWERGGYAQGCYEYDPEIFHCGPMSGSEDIR